MVSKASDEGSPARAALEKSLTLNKKQSWFGSIKSAVHQGALSAKAAVESLRGGGGNSTSLVDTDSPHTRTGTPTARLCTKQAGRDETCSPPKSAVASLRQQFNRRSRNSRRGSVSEVFRRSGSNSSNLRGAQGVRNSQEVARYVSSLSEEDGSGKDVAFFVPLPSSPIDAPSPTPTLRLDLGPSGLNIASEFAEIKALQDPKNITTGAPASHPLGWGYKSQFLDLDRRDTAMPEPTLSNVDSKAASISVRAPESLPPSTDTTEEPKPQNWCCDPTASPSKTADHTPKDSMAEANHRTPISEKRGSGLVGPRPFRSKAVRTPEDAPKTSMEVFQLPAPLFALYPSFSEGTADMTRRTDHANCASHESKRAECFEPTQPKGAVETSDTQGQATARQRYAEALLSSQTMDLDFGVTQHVAQNPFRGGPGIPPPDSRSESNLTQATLTSASLSDAKPISEACVDASVANKTRPLTVKRNDVLSEDSRCGSVPQKPAQHGPPSPTRSVQLPLRPKSLLMKHSSYEFMVFRPILDRVAAKRLGVFRPSSDPTLRQRYFPHVAIHTITSPEYPRQSSLDSDGSGNTQKQDGSEDSGSGDGAGIFERAVERPSPLHIRKQSGAELKREAPSPRSSVRASDSSPIRSSPSRTPSMGDRQLFEMQRAKRNARYSAIRSGNFDAVVSFGSDLHLADFGNAGPGSRGSTPRRNSVG